MPRTESALFRIARSACFITIILSLFNPVIAKSDNVKVVVPFLGERLLTQDKNGFWADMLRQLLTDLAAPYEYVVLPFQRAAADFSSGDYDCIWLFDKKLLRKLGVETTGLLESESVFESTQHVFLSSRLSMISSMDDLRGKRVGIGTGSQYLKQLKNASAEIVILSDQTSKIRLLANDRIDAFIGWLPDTLIMDTDHLLDPALVKRNLKMSSTGTTFVCHDTILNSGFVKKLDSNIRIYRTSDSFRALFESYGASQMLND